ncbi:SEC1A, partial [Symbiodinium sp. CCMP2456]
ATTVPPDLNVEDILETEDGLPRLGTAKVGMPAGMPTPPSRAVLKAPDASKFMKMFEQNQSLQQAAETAPGAGGFPGRRGRRWTVVANQVHNLANIKPPEEDTKQTPAERSINRNSVRLGNLPSGQRASTALPGGKVGNLDDLFDEEELGRQVGGNAGNASSDAQAWKGWYKIKSKAKTADAAELEAAAFGATRPTSILDTLTTAPAEQTGASKEVIEAAGKWQAVCEETEAATEESTNFANGLPPGIGKLAAVLVNRFGSLERAFYNFDYNRKGKITRGQWQTVFATVRIDVQEVFRMIASFGESTSTLEISFDQWRLFFETELAGGECAFLLSEDRGSQAPKRWEKVKKMPGKALKALVEHVDEVEAAHTALRRYISGEAVLEARVYVPLPLPFYVKWPWCLLISAALVHTFNASALRLLRDSGNSSDGDGESSKRRRKGKRREEDGAQGDTSSDSDEGGSASRRSLKPATEDGNSASASSAVGDVHGDGDADNAASSEPTASKGGAETMPWPKDDSSDWSSSSDSDVAEGEAKKAAVKKSLGAHSGVDARRVNRDKVMKAFTERDDTAIAQLNDDELQALAEQVQLQEEIEQFDLSSIDAFAYVLLAKMGSFKRAFNWFDFNCSKKITNVTWDTGILLLHVDTEKLTGLKPSNIFYRMDTCTEDPPTGMITSTSATT